MAGEQCHVCDALVSFSDTVHVLVNTRNDEGVADYYVCRGCYDDAISPLFE